MILDGRPQGLACVGFAHRLAGEFSQCRLVLAQRVGEFDDRHAIFAERSLDDIEFGDGNR